MSNNININSMLRPSLDSEEEEEDDIGQMSDGSSSSSGGSSNRSSSSSSSSAPGSLPEDDVDVEDEDMSDQDALSESETEDDTTTCQSDELELAQLSKRDTFRLPRGLCENSTIFHEFFSMETWQLLPQHVQARLQCLLPDFTGLVSAPQAGAEQQRTLVQLFNGGLQRFGQSPLLQLQRQLEDGNLRPDVLKLRRSIQHSSRREFRFQQAERLSQLAKELFLSREHMLKLAYTSSPPEEATASASASKSMMPRPRKRKPPALSMENKLCSQRAKKRYVQELLEVIQELKVSPGEISAEEEDEECVDLMQRLPKMEAELKLEPTSVRSSNAADKKSIYNTFFKRRSGVDDEQVLRTMQAVRIQQLNDKNFKKYLRDYKRRKMEQPESPEFDTSEVRLRDICTRAQFVGSFKPGRKPKALLARLNPDPPALVPIGGIKNEPEDDIFVKEEPQQHQKQHRLQDYVPKEQMPKKMPPAAAAAPVPALIPKLEPISVPSATISNLTTISPTNPALKAAAVHIVGSPPNRGEVVRPAASPRPACYFSLLRDLFVSTPQHRLTYGELQLLLASWREKHSDAAIPTGDVTRIQQPDWSLLLQSAVNFLAADFGPLPAEYVPYIEHKTVLNIYQWIGAGRDSDARLCTLCQYWLRTQKEEQPIATTVHLNPCPGAMFIATTPVDASATQTLTPTPPPRCPTSWTVRTASQADMLEFQRQERLRFEYPHRPFTYRLNGYESVVGPVKGIYTQSLPLNKARGHAVMVDDRPPFVTILTLVRDATARLPNGEGTRSEISELLKCSQYVNHQAAENVLQTIVSGALDRMHGGIDPCVKYDAKRKIWIYLHRNRSEEEFERMHKHNLSLVKQKQQQRKQLAKPKKEDGDSSTELQDMPALVPSVGNPTPTAAPVSVSTAAGTLLHVKKTSPLPVKCPPVPPLKYNIPPANSNNNNNSTSSSQGTGMALSPTGANASPNSMQKSLLKPVPMGAVHRPMAGGTPVKTGNFAISKISPQRNTTPILVSTPSGMQTVHVATTPTSTQLGTSPTMSVNKKLTIKKPPTTSKIGNFIIPLDQQQQQQQQHSPQQHSQVLGKPKSMTISPRPQLSKNIIRLLPAGAAATGQVKSPQVQILGPRVVPQSTVRPVQQKIGAVSIISNKSVEASTSPITIATSSSSAVSAVSVGGGAGGTIVKMSPQAFATLQQQQLKQKAMGGTAKIASPVQTSPQQRILVGNTAISSNKKIVFQAMAKTTPKILTTTASSGGTTVRSPQQRIVLQNFKQAAAAGGGGATTVVSSTNATRMIRTSTTVSTAAGGAVNASQGGHIITLDSLLQKQHQQQHSGGKLLTTGSNIIQLATSSAGNVITLTPNQSQNTQPIQVQAKHLPTMARIVSATASGGGPTMVPKIIGKTTVLPGKPLLLHAKAIKQLGGGSVVTTQPTATTTTAGTNAVRTTQSIVIGGQTVKIQGAIPARSGGAPMQTVIMGNQLVRLAPSTSGSSSTNSNHLTTVASSGIATAPKTLLIGAGGTQTLRLAKNVLLTNKQGTSNSTGSSNATGSVTGGATAGNNLVFAVQGNGGQLFFSQGLQGMNLKPLSNMKVIPMVSTAGAAATAGGKITVTTTAKAEAKKLMPGTVLKTAPSGSGN